MRHHSPHDDACQVYRKDALFVDDVDLDAGEV